MLRWHAEVAARALRRGDTGYRISIPGNALTTTRFSVSCDLGFWAREHVKVTLRIFSV